MPFHNLLTSQTLLPLKRLPSKLHLLHLQQTTLVLQSTHQLIQLQGAINLVRFNLHKFKYGSYNIDFEANFQKLENPFLRLRSGHWLILLIIKECSMLEQTIWPSNHTSNTKVTSMNLLHMPCVITWAWSFLTSEVVEAVRGQKHHIWVYTLAL